PRLARYAFCFSHYRCIGLVAGRRCHSNMCADARPDRQQRMAHVVSVADVCEFQAAQPAETLLESEKICKCLARVKTVGKRVDHRDAAVLCHAVQGLLREHACDNSVNHALEILCHVANGFALPKPCCRMVKKDRCTAEACYPHFER